jgi:hypothetical protein
LLDYKSLPIILIFDSVTSDLVLGRAIPASPESRSGSRGEVAGPRRIARSIVRMAERRDPVVLKESSTWQQLRENQNKYFRDSNSKESEEAADEIIVCRLERAFLASLLNIVDRLPLSSDVVLSLVDPYHDFKGHGHE